MSTAPREDSVRSRRRRRKAPATPNRTGSDHHPTSPSHPYHRRQCPIQPPRTPTSIPRDGSSNRETTLPSEYSPHTPTSQSGLEPQHHPNNPVGSQAHPADSSATSSASKSIESLREQRQKEDQERQRRLEQQREHLARRESERRKNLCFSQSQDVDGIRKERLSDTELRQLDSSLKKCTGFLRKIRSLGFTEETIIALRSEAAHLNLSRYISEVVSAMVENKLRSNDVEHLVLLCGEMHRRYEDFTPQLVSSLTNLITSSSTGGNTKDVFTRKAAFRLLVDMFVLGIYVDVTPISSVLRQLMKSSKDSYEEASACLGVITSFARFSTRTILPVLSDSVTGVHNDPESNSSQSASWETSILSRSAKESLLSALRSYFDSDVKRLLRDAGEELRKTSLAITRSAQVRGTADENATHNYENAKQFHDKVLSSANILAECIGKPVLEPSGQTPPTRGASIDIKVSQEPPHIVISNPFSASAKGKQTSQESDILVDIEHPFEGEGEKEFYIALISMGSHIPMDQNKSQCSIQDSECKGPSSEKTKIGSDREQDSVPVLEKPENKHEHFSESLGGMTQASRLSKESRKKDADKPASVEKVLARLPSVETREEADVFVRLFAVSAEGSRNGTKRLAKALYSVSPQKLNLLPAYARIAATLRQTYPDVPAVVATSLEEDFRSLVAKSDVDEKSLAACIKTAQYIGEYVKFTILEIPTMFELLSLCMKDFSGHRVDVACHLLESCGRFVYLSTSSHLRMVNILETLWRLKSVKNLEARHNTLVETAYFAVRLSPGSKAHRKKTRPPIREYIRHLIYYRLDASNIRWIHGQFMKLPWNDELEKYVIKKFVKISRARYSTIPYVSTLVAFFQKQKPALAVGIVDALLEAIRTGMEKNDGRDSQRRIAEVYLLGEMHKCGVVGEKIIYNVLYQLITLGHESPNSYQRSRRIVGVPAIGTEDLHQTNEDPSIRRNLGTYLSAPDPPADFFRIRLACMLIDCCGRVLVASNRRKLEVFWIFFERYMFCKTHQAGQGDLLPLHIGHIVSDVFESVLQRPRRVGKEGRLSQPRDDSSSRSGSKESSDITLHQSCLFSRSNSLQEALAAVSRVQRSGSDTALISVSVRHVRHVVSVNMSSSIDSVTIAPNSRRDGPALLKPSPGSGIRGNFKDGFVTTSVRIAELEDRRQWEMRSASGQKGETFESRHFGPRAYEESEYPASGDDTYDYVENRTADDNDTEREEEDDLLGATGNDELPGGGSVIEEIFDEEEDEEDEDDEDNGADDECDDVDDDDEEDGEEDDEEEDEDDDVIFESRLSRPRTEEEDTFAKELAACTAAAVHSARASSSRVAKLDRMAIPMSLMTQKLEEEKAAAAAQAANTVDNTTSSEEDEDGKASRKNRRPREKSVEFKMLLRKGGKSQLQGIQVPASSSLAVAAKENESADAARHEETKRLVLGSSIVLNDDSDDLEDEVQLQAQQHAREKQESIRQQRSADEMELLSTLYRVKPRR